MLTLINIAALAMLYTFGQEPTQATNRDDLIREIEGVWQGKVVRDEVDPKHPVVEIDFHCSSEVPDDVIAKLIAFPQLRKLGLIGGQKLTNKGIEHVSKLTNLKSLELRNGNLTSDGLIYLSKLPNLQYLFLWDMHLRKEEAIALEGLQELEILQLRSITASTEVLASLNKLPRLKEIKEFRCGGVFKSMEEVQKALPQVKVQLSS